MDLRSMLTVDLLTLADSVKAEVHRRLLEQEAGAVVAEVRRLIEGRPAPVDEPITAHELAARLGVAASELRTRLRRADWRWLRDLGRAGKGPGKGLRWRWGEVEAMRTRKGAGT